MKPPSVKSVRCAIYTRTADSQITTSGGDAQPLRCPSPNYSWDVAIGNASARHQPD